MLKVVKQSVVMLAIGAGAASLDDSARRSAFAKRRLIVQRDGAMARRGRSMRSNCVLSLRMRRWETRARVRTPGTVDQGHAAAFRVTRAVVSRLAHGAPVEAGWRRFLDTLESPPCCASCSSGADDRTTGNVARESGSTDECPGMRTRLRHADCLRPILRPITELEGSEVKLGGNCR